MTPQNEMTPLPFEGLRLIELTTGAAGPTVGKVLAEWGMEVIHAETRHRGDAHRGQDPKRWNQRPDFVKLHRGKKSFTVDMSKEKGRELVRRLIRLSDVLVENYGLGVVERWGLDYEQVKALKPDIIMVRVKGLGSTGPHAKDLTYGPNVGNLNGTTYLWNYPGSPVPTAEARSQHPDFMGGVTAAYSVVLALMHRAKTGQGQLIDNAQIEVGASLLGPWYLEYQVNGRAPEPKGTHSFNAAPYGAYRCAGKDQWCVIEVWGQAEWEPFCRVIGRPELACEGKFATHLGRVQHKAELDDLVEAWTRERDRYAVMETLQRAGIGAAAVQDVEDQFTRDVQYAARGCLEPIHEPEMGDIVSEAIPVRHSATPGQMPGPAPLMGEHTYQICRELLQLSDEEIKALDEEGVLY